jgi:hypothetical protein
MHPSCHKAYPRRRDVHCIIPSRTDNDRCALCIVMTGLVPDISGGAVPRQMAGTSPVMTMEAKGSRQ